MQGVTKLCRPLEGPRLRDALNHAYTRLFKEYTSSIAEELKTYRDPDNELPEELRESPNPPHANKSRVPSS